MTPKYRIMLKMYAEKRALIQVIREGVKKIRRGIEICAEQGLPSEPLFGVIESVKKDYLRLRLECFRMRRKLLLVMSAAEIMNAYRAYARRHNG